MFLYTQLALILSAVFFDALLIEGVNYGRKGVERLPFGETCSSDDHGVLENKVAGVESHVEVDKSERTKAWGEGGYLSTLGSRRARKS